MNQQDERDPAEEAANRELLENPDGDEQAEQIVNDGERYRKLQEHVGRYFRARYGDDYVFKAPETFPNALERWMLYIASGNEGGDAMAETTMKDIEEHVRP
jgi:hypothetical protein